MYVDEKTGKPLQNVRIKHTLIIDEGDFENDNIIKGLRDIIPSRSPSPIKITESKRLLNDDGTVNFEITENTTGFVDDDVDLQELVVKMSKS